MAALATPRPTPAEPPNPAEHVLGNWQARLPLAVAYSGGADSTTLLLGCAARWPGQICAIHIHHGLQSAADEFAAHCQLVCKALCLPLVVVRVQARNVPGESPEDAARKARYRALAGAAQAEGAQEVLLAQHADDQVETVLLALSRGAGLPGLAAMPAKFERHGMLFGRPLLSLSAASLRAWLQQRHQGYVLDPSNEDTRLTRNRIRHVLLPALAQAFAQYRETFSRTAQHAAQAQLLLEEVAIGDLQFTGQPPRIALLQALSRARVANLLRYWLRQAHGTTATSAQMAQLLDQVNACTTRGHGIHIKVGNGFVLRCGEQLAYLQPRSTSNSPRII
jgi:tRNA(Ile)-lysidine synthase